MQGNPSPETVGLWQRIQICRTFPAYKLAELDTEPGYPDLLRALKLIELADKASQPAK